MFCNPVSTTIALSAAQEEGQNTNVRLFSVKAIDYSIGCYAPNVKARYSVFTSSPKNHSDRDIAADIFLLADTPFFTTFSTCQFATRANYEAEWRFAEF